jgi:dihydrodipicolinate synthase/N-acetylneuraminate lyase
MPSKDELIEHFKKIIDAMGLDIVAVNENGIVLEWIEGRRKMKLR